HRPARRLRPRPGVRGLARQRPDADRRPRGDSRVHAPRADRPLSRRTPAGRPLLARGHALLPTDWPLRLRFPAAGRAEDPDDPPGRTRPPPGTPTRAPARPDRRRRPQPRPRALRPLPRRPGDAGGPGGGSVSPAASAGTYGGWGNKAQMLRVGGCEPQGDRGHDGFLPNVWVGATRLGASVRHHEWHVDNRKLLCRLDLGRFLGG